MVSSMSITMALAIYGAVIATVSSGIGAVAFLRTLPKAVEWSITPVGHNSFALLNSGRRDARGVRVLPTSGVFITNRGTEPFEVPAGQSWSFVIASPSPHLAGGWQLLLTWNGHLNPYPVPLPVNPPVPPRHSPMGGIQF